MTWDDIITTIHQTFQLSFLKCMEWLALNISKQLMAQPIAWDGSLLTNPLPTHPGHPKLIEHVLDPELSMTSRSYHANIPPFTRNNLPSYYSTIHFLREKICLNGFKWYPDVSGIVKSFGHWTFPHISNYSFHQVWSYPELKFARWIEV